MKSFDSDIAVNLSILLLIDSIVVFVQSEECAKCKPCLVVPRTKFDTEALRVVGMQGVRGREQFVHSADVAQESSHVRKYAQRSDQRRLYFPSRCNRIFLSDLPWRSQSKLWPPFFYHLSDLFVSVNIAFGDIAFTSRDSFENGHASLLKFERFDIDQIC